MSLDDKIKEAEQALRLAAEMSEYYYHKPLIVCYSGGKDSDVLLDIAKKCLTPEQFEVLNSHTTVDAPETVYHIRDTFKALETEGIHTEVRMPMYKGKRTTMWDLIAEKGIPPTRIMRYCCEVLKETSTPNRMVAVGVREDESNGRKGRAEFASLGKRKEDGVWKSTQHTYAMFKLDQLEQDTYECKIIEACKKNKDTLVNPIYKFDERDIWEYIKRYDLKVCSLYSKGYSRVGCIGCPLAGSKKQNQEFLDYPIYKQNYIKAFEKMLKRNEEKSVSFKKYHFTTGEEVFRWWLGEDPKQVRIEDIMEV